MQYSTIGGKLGKSITVDCSTEIVLSRGTGQVCFSTHKMTSTGINQGYDPNGKSSSRVAQPPGGQSNISLFGGPDAGPMPSRRSAEPVSSSPSVSEKRMPNQQKDKGPPKPIKPFQTYDTVTGAAYQYSSQGKAAATKEPPKPKETEKPELQVGARVRAEGKTRVTQPPGGRSQITF